MIWDELTSPRIDRLDRSIPVYVNIAAIEQHGPHLPLATDALIGAHFLDGLDRQMPEDVLIAPQIKVCCSRHHLDFAGTLSVDHTTLLAYLSDVASSIFDSGFRTLVIFNSHGGNQAIGQVAVEKIGADFANRQVLLATWWTLARDALSKLSDSGPFGTGHACELETSLIQHIAPHLVVEPVPTGTHYQPTFELADGDMLMPATVSLFRTMKQISGGNGVVGAPGVASPEKGAKITEIVVGRLVQLTNELRNREGP